MSTSEQKFFELRHGDQVLAHLIAKPGQKIELAHDLTELQLRMLPTVIPFESGRELTISVGNIRPGVTVAFSDKDGVERLGLGEDEFRLLAVVDPKRLAGLRTTLVGAGSIGDQPIAVAGGFVLELGPFEKVRLYAERVKQLFGNTRNWLEGLPVKISEQVVEVTEDVYGTYQIASLEFRTRSGERIARLIPIAASVLAAEGRVDLVGSLGREGFIYLASGGPQINLGGTKRRLIQADFSPPLPWSHGRRLVLDLQCPSQRGSTARQGSFPEDANRRLGYLYLCDLTR